MKRVFLVLIVLTLAFTVTASASDGRPWTPENVELAYPMDGWFCMWTDGEFNGCFSCCNEDYIACEVCQECQACPEQEPCPECRDCENCEDCPACETCKDCETCKECEQCEQCQECKEKSNAGRGNASEGDPDQDPGNSGNNQGGD